MRKILIILQSYRSLLIWGSIIICLIALLVGGIWYSLHRKAQLREQALEKGLGEVKVIRQTETGRTKKLNITETAFQILQASITQEGRLDKQAKTKIENLSIKDVEFPPIPKNKLRTFQTSDKQDIAQYFQRVYNILNVKYKDVTVQNIGKKALDNKDNSQRLRQLQRVNKNMYLDLMNIQIPQEVTSIHTAYVRITQIQHHFISELRQSSQDPLGVKTNYILVVQILQELRPKLNTEISKVEQTYDLQLQKQKRSSSQSK